MESSQKCSGHGRPSNAIVKGEELKGGRLYIRTSLEMEKQAITVLLAYIYLSIYICIFQIFLYDLSICESELQGVVGCKTCSFTKILKLCLHCIFFSFVFQFLLTLGEVLVLQEKNQKNKTRLGIQCFHQYPQVSSLMFYIATHCSLQGVSFICISRKTLHTAATSALTSLIKQKHNMLKWSKKPLVLTSAHKDFFSFFLCFLPSFPSVTCHGWGKKVDMKMLKENVN